jgi:hypothetical protein
VPTNFICEFKITEKVDLPPFISCGTIGGPYFEAGILLVIIVSGFRIRIFLN